MAIGTLRKRAQLTGGTFPPIVTRTPTNDQAGTLPQTQRLPHIFEFLPKMVDFRRNGRIFKIHFEACYKFRNLNVPLRCGVVRGSSVFHVTLCSAMSLSSYHYPLV